MKMKKIILFVLIIPLTVVSETFVDLLRERLESDTGYLTALEHMNEAKQLMRSDTLWFLPYFDLDTRLSLYDEFHLEMNPTISFNIEGWTFLLSNTISLDERNVAERGWTFSLSKELFDDERIDDLETFSNFLKRKWDLLSSKNRVFKKLVQEILDSWLKRRKTEILSERIKIMRKKLEEDKGKKGRTISKDEILLMEKNIISLESNIKKLEKDLIDTVKVNDELYKEVMDIVKSLIRVNVRDFNVENRLDVKAQKILLEASKKRERRILLEYLPSPRLYLNWFENPPQGSENFSIGFELKWSISDRGEREEKVESIRLDYRIAKANYENLLDTVKKEFEGIKKDLEMVKQQRELAEIDLELARSEYERASRKFKQGLINEEDLTLSRLNVEEKELELEEQKINEILLKLDLLSVVGMDLTSEVME
ncbi:MAG: hypothetical protein DRP38_00120 [Thermotogae bacterium]|nr:MAG: hypothetical protein DRP38_00120 [Thermotogota bacterium]